MPICPGTRQSPKIMGFIILRLTYFTLKMVETIYLEYDHSDVLEVRSAVEKQIPNLLSCQGCGSLVSVSHSAGALSYRYTEDSSSPEILLGLIYNSTTGQLFAEVIQGSHFKTSASDKPVSMYESSHV